MSDSEDDIENGSADTVVKARKRRIVVVNTVECRYDVVRSAVRSLGWHVENGAGVDDEDPTMRRLASEEWYKAATSPQIHWIDTSIVISRLVALPPWRRVNHFPDVTLLSHKMALFARLMRMRSLLPEAYDTFPLSWAHGSKDLVNYIASLKGRVKTFVMKPNNMCQGKGIVLTRTPLTETLSGDYLVQVYVHRPLLIDERKFDLRVYVLLAGLGVEAQLPTVYIHREGLVRICGEPFRRPSAGNLDDVCVHLTNYAINREHPSFTIDPAGESGLKRNFAYLETMAKELPLAAWGEVGDARDAWTVLLRRLDRAIVLTLMSAIPEMRRQYAAGSRGDASSRKSFELLGFDVLFTQSGRVRVLEVNHSPSLCCGSDLDFAIKEKVVADSLRLVAPYTAGLRCATSKAYAAFCAKKQRQREVDDSHRTTSFRCVCPLPSTTAGEAYTDAYAAETQQLYEVALRCSITGLRP